MINTVEEPSYIANIEKEISLPAIILCARGQEDITDKAACQKYPQKRLAETLDEHTCCKKKKVENYNTIYFQNQYKDGSDCEKINSYGDEIKLFVSSNIFLEIQNDNLNEVIRLYNLQSCSMNKIYPETNGQTLLEYSIIKKAKLVSDWFLQNEVTDLFKKKYL